MPRSKKKTTHHKGRLPAATKAAVLQELASGDPAPAIAQRLIDAGHRVSVNTIRSQRANLHNGKHNDQRKAPPPVALNEAHDALHRVTAQRDRLANLLIDVLTEEGAGWRLVKVGGGR